MTLRAVVGLGANMGDRLATMRAAMRDLSRVASVRARSRVYASAPVGGPPQPEFLNAAALVSYARPPLDLLDALLHIELLHGRTRSTRWGPRLIDLDLLWIDGIIIDSERLAVPHPRLAQRAFALVPLLEVAPHARDPRTGHPYVIPPGDVRPTGEHLASM